MLVENPKFHLSPSLKIFCEQAAYLFRRFVGNLHKHMSWVTIQTQEDGSVENLMDGLQAAVNEDASLQHWGRWVSLEFLLGVGDTDYLIRIEEGRVAGVRLRSLPIESGMFTIRAAADVWAEHWRPVPKRDYHDLFSMLSAGIAQLDGDIKPLMQNLIYFKGLIAAPRAIAEGAEL